MAHVTVSSKGVGRFQQDVELGRHRLVADEPTDVGGDDAGPAPHDLLLASLGTCTAMTIQMYAERKAFKLDHVSVALDYRKVDVEGEHRHRIDRRITLKGALSPEERQRLLDIANRCPVHRTLQEPLLIETQLTE